MIEQLDYRNYRRSNSRSQIVLGQIITEELFRYVSVAENHAIVTEFKNELGLPTEFCCSVT